jgi:endonuclease/exonuclease/phosphatase family metal-dependent hydrolase
VVVPELTVMTWNVQNLFPAGTGDGPATQQEYDRKVAGLARVIDAARPDVVGLQEIGPESVLADLSAACAVDFDHRVTGSPDVRGIRVALMSSRRLTNRVNVTTFPSGLAPVQAKDLTLDDSSTPDDEAFSDRAGRGVLSARLRCGGETVTVIVAHLKSKLVSYTRRAGEAGSTFAPNDEEERSRYAGYALFRRTAEAMTCRATLNAALTAGGFEPGLGRGAGTTDPVIFCGDLNDGPLAATTQMIGGPGGSEIDFRPGSGFRTGDTGDGYRMWNLNRLLPPERANYTRIYRGQGELIDHIFASHRLVNPDNLPAVEILSASPLPSMTNDPIPSTSAPSDHAAVVATFNL